MYYWNIAPLNHYTVITKYTRHIKMSNVIIYISRWFINEVDNIWVDSTKILLSILDAIVSLWRPTKASVSGMQRRDAGICAFAVFRSISQFATLVMHHVVDDIRNCIACAAELQSGDWIMQRCCASCASRAAKPSHGIKPVTMLTKQYTYRWGYRCVLPSREIAEAVAAATYACRCTMPRITHSTPINMIRPETLIAFYLSLRLEIA